MGAPAAATASADSGSSASEQSGNRGAASSTDGNRADDSGDGADPGDRDVRAGGDDESDPDDQNDPDAAGDPDEQDAADAPDVQAGAEADEGEAGSIDTEDEGEDAGPRPPCCADDDDCGHGGWPWPWPQPDPEEPVEDSTGSDGSYGGGAPMSPPVVRPPLGGAQPPEVVPPIQEPPDPDVLDVVPGVGIPAAGAPVNLPLIVPAPVAAGPGPVAGPAAGGAGAGGGGVAGLPAAPRQATAAPPRARQPLPASAGSNVTMPATSYRVGYADYLRTAGVSQIAALALPGLAGLLVLTGAGGLVGYRQAKAGHVVRPSGVARFMNQPGS